jgi:hypothetical protein
MLDGLSGATQGVLTTLVVADFVRRDRFGIHAGDQSVKSAAGAWNAAAGT